MPVRQGRQVPAVLVVELLCGDIVDICASKACRVLPMQPAQYRSDVVHDFL